MIMMYVTLAAVISLERRFELGASAFAVNDK